MRVRRAVGLSFLLTSLVIPATAQAGVGAGHAAALLPDRSVVVSGGRGSDGQPTSAAVLYAPGQSDATTVGRLVTPRAGHTETPLFDGRVLVVGGADAQGPLGSLEIFDPLSNAFFPSAATLQSPREGHTATALPDGRVLIEGGHDASGEVTTAELYDPDTDTISPAGALDSFAFPVVTTDQADYLPGDTVLVSGRGWRAGENVEMLLDEEPLQHAPIIFSAVADGQGSIASFAAYLVEDHDYGTAFALHAAGATSGWTADTTFHDGSQLVVSNFRVLAPSGATDGVLSAGQQFAVAFTVTNRSSQGGPTPAFNDIQVALNLPRFWSASSAPAPFTLAAGGSIDVSFTVTSGTALGKASVGVSVQGTPASGTCSTTGISCTGSGSLALSVVRPAVLAVDPPSLPTSVRAGNSLSFPVVVRNTASAPGAAATNVQVSFASSGSASGSCAPITVTSISASGSTTLTANCSASGSGSLHFDVTAGGADENSGTLLSAFASSSSTTVIAEAPILSGVPQDTTVAAVDRTGATVTWTAPTATDAVDGSLPVTCTPASGTRFPLGSTRVTCSATNSAGKTASGSFSVSVVDTTAPVLTLPSNLVAEATGPAGASVTFTFSAADAVDGAVAVTCAPGSGATFALGVTSVACSARDSAGNQASGSFTVTVRDTTPPALTLPALIAMEATGPAGTVVQYSASAFDLVSGAVAITCTPGAGATFAVGVTSVACSAHDALGNQASGSFTVTVRDTTPPALRLPDDLLAEATGPSGANVTFEASAVDLVDGAVAMNCTPGSGTTFALGSTTVACTAHDTLGNEALGSFMVTVRDTTPPALTIPAPIVAEATGLSGASVAFTASAADLVDGAVVVTCTPSSGATFPLGITTVACAARDFAGNQASGNFTITVRDTTPPALTLPDQLVAEATGPNGAAVTFSASAVDLVDGPVPVACTPHSGATLALGTTTVNCTARDSAGNQASGSFTVTVRDTTPPALTLPQPIVAEALGPAGAPVQFNASAVDLVDGQVAVTCTPASGATFAIGTTTVTCTTHDAAGNAASDSFAITVRDTTPPALTLPDPVVAEATGPAGASVTFAPSAIDLVDGAVAVGCSPSPGATFAIGTTTVSCLASDAAGNTISGSFSVTVRDTTPPALSLPDPIVAEATGPAGASVLYSATALDLVDGAVAVTCTPGSDTTFALGTTTVTCAAHDAAQNAASASFTITVRDTTPPTLTLPQSLSAEAIGPAGAPVSFDASAHDVVDGAVAVDCSASSGGTFALGPTTVTCSAHDAAGNAASGSFTVRVVDTTPPVVTVPDSLLLTATSSAGAVVTYNASASDLVDGAVTPRCTPASGAQFPMGSTSVTCTAADRAGNASSRSFVVSVVYAWSNLLQPVRIDGSSVFKQGSTVPVKFQLTGSSAGISSAVAALYLARVSDGTAGSDVVALSTSSADSGNLFRYDPASGQYIFNLATKSLAEGTWRLHVDLGDGVSRWTYVGIRK